MDSEYIVAWQHGPAPGLTFYNGEERVMAEDTDDAARQCKRVLKQKACFSPSCITILAVKPA